MTYRPIEILLVEDSPGDVWLTREALMQGKVPKNISVVTNGEQAIDFLHNKGQYANAPRPDLVLLDLNLPRRDGLEVLREIKTDPDLKSITVIVLTTSEAPMDVNSAYDLNANCFVVKPVDLDEFTVTIRGIEEFWMTLASLPTVAPPQGAGGTPGSVDQSAAGNATESSNGSPTTSWSRRLIRTSRRPARRKRELMRPGLRVRSRGGLT